ncbi:MAG TPA: hypothetical protein VK079_00640 [Bacillota bacterium]|nr:hypothetical protein [Bacillota bacterium]
MNEYLQTNKRSFILLTILFFILAIVLYFMVVRPLTEDLTRHEINIMTAENNIAELEKTLQRLEVTPEDDEFEDLLLEKIIPKERELDDYILSLQQLELTTESQIEQINFVYDSQIADHEQVDDEDEVDATDTEVDETDATDDENNSEEENSADEDEDETTPLEPTFIYEKPVDLHAISVQIDAISPSLDEFIKFLQTIEQSERLSIVSQLRFDHPTEHDEFFEDEPTTDITFQIELTTFYYDH